MQKSDHCIWAKHCSKDQILKDTISELVPEQQLTLMVNGTPTVFQRMNNGTNGVPTLGLKNVHRGSAWHMLKLGETCEICLPQNAIPISQPNISIPPEERVVIERVMPKSISVSGSSLFHSYVFADYSGAADLGAQRKSIKLAYAEGSDDSKLAEGPFTRDTLVTAVLDYLRDATAAGKRICFGFDHQFGIPVGLLQEIGIAGLSWREILEALVDGRGVPALKHPKEYAREFNDWCQARGRLPYFYSATKATSYGIPKTSPRGKDDTVFRLTERCASGSGKRNPMPFNRVGDNGSVGGQTLVGIIKLHQLLNVCKTEGIPIKCWPFDGLDISSSSYKGSHVLLEPYPSAVRSSVVSQTDANDAIASVQFLQRADQAGELANLLDLSCLSDTQRKMVLVEGWIVGHSPLSLNGAKRWGSGQNGWGITTGDTVIGGSKNMKSIELYYEDGSILYKGEAKDGKPNGHGKTYFENGAVGYEGEFENGLQNGQGTAFYEDGTIKYKGEFKDGLPHGIVTGYSENGILRYEGEHKQGAAHGYGKVYLKNGNRYYEGEFINSHPHGQGEIYYEDGRIKYKGEFKEGLPNGQGTFYYNSGAVMYTGEFKNGRQCGQGTSYYEDGTIAYNGWYRNGIQNGPGTGYYEDGTLMCEGEFIEGLQNGQGSSYYENGNIHYRGEWKNHEFHGQGTIYDERGTIIYNGKLEKGLPHGQGTSYSEEGTVGYQGEWRRGRPVGSARPRDKHFD